MFKISSKIFFPSTFKSEKVVVSRKKIQLLARLSLSMSHLHEHKLRHIFSTYRYPICNCHEDIETSCHYLLRCSIYSNERLDSRKENPWNPPPPPPPLPSLDPYPNCNPNLTLILTLYEGFFPGVFFPDTKRLTLLNIINVIDTSILEKNDSEATKVLRYG